MKTMTVAIDRPIQSHTSTIDKVKIETEPNNVVQTSAETLDEVGKIFINKYPIANAPTDSIATAASPLILLFCDVLNRSIAAPMVTGIAIIMLLVKPTTAATAIAPKAI